MEEKTIVQLNEIYFQCYNQFKDALQAKQAFE